MKETQKDKEVQGVFKEVLMRMDHRIKARFSLSQGVFPNPHQVLIGFSPGIPAGAPSILLVLVVYYCIANYHKLSILKQYSIISFHFCKSEVWAQQLRVSQG